MAREENLRTPKGTRDISPVEAALKEDLISICTKVFRNHSGNPIETPTFELRENLQEKYGEDTKLIFHLEDQDGDICSLRYDLTVPFARFISSHRCNRMRKYQIGNVFRRDNPGKGRLREFTQADFDICGDSESQTAIDSEILYMADKIIRDIELKYKLGTHKISVNHRGIVWGILEALEIREELFPTICSTMDKVDKLPRDSLIAEFIAKGITSEQATELYSILVRKNDLVEFLRDFLHKNRLAHLDELMSVLNYSVILGASVSFDLSLIRGLCYYTGMIFEIALNDSSFGSIGGGGRYDNLCSSLSDFSVPCAGFSIGVSRLIASILEQKQNEEIVNSNLEKDFLICSVYGLCIEERLRLMKLLSPLFKVELFPITKKINFSKQIKYARNQKFKFIISTGENEIKDNKVVLFNVLTSEKSIISVVGLLETLRQMLNK